MARLRVSPTTYVAYETRVARLIPLIGTHRLPRITPSNIQNAYGELGTLAARTIRGTHATVRRALQQAVDWDLLARNPADAVVLPRVGHQEMQTLTAEQVRTLFAGTREDELRALWVLLATTGMRIREALGLRWADIDGGTLHVRRTLHPERGQGLVMASPKTRAGVRTVHLTAQAVAALKAYRARQLEARLSAGPLWVEQDLVFANPTGGPRHARRVLVAWHGALTQTGLPQVRLRDLRHTTASLLL